MYNNKQTNGNPKNNKQTRIMYNRKKTEKYKIKINNVLRDV